jgi:hypothetical protein
MGGAVAAGPSMAKAVATDISVMGLGPAAAIPREVAPLTFDFVPTLFSSRPKIDPNTSEHPVQKDLAEFLAKSASDLAREKAGTSVSALDPDLAVNRSMSLQHKISAQRARNFERNREREGRRLRSKLADAIRDWVVS